MRRNCVLKLGETCSSLQLTMGLDKDHPSLSPLETNVNLSLASVDIGFLGVTIFHVNTSSYKITPPCVFICSMFHRSYLSFIVIRWSAWNMCIIPFFYIIKICSNQDPLFDRIYVNTPRSLKVILMAATRYLTVVFKALSFKSKEKGIYVFKNIKKKFQYL